MNSNYAIDTLRCITEIIVFRAEAIRENTLSPFHCNRLFSKWPFHFKAMLQNVSFQNHFFFIKNLANIALLLNAVFIYVVN